MNTTPRNHAAPSRARRLLSVVRDDLRERRESRTEQRRIERELGTYTSPSEVNDILTVLQSESGAHADRMRTMVTRNLQHQQRTKLAS